MSKQIHTAIFAMRTYRVVIGPIFPPVCARGGGDGVGAFRREDTRVEGARNGAITEVTSDESRDVVVGGADGVPRFLQEWLGEERGEVDRSRRRAGGEGTVEFGTGPVGNGCGRLGPVSRLGGRVGGHVGGWRLVGCTSAARATRKGFPWSLGVGGSFPWSAVG